VSDSNVVPRHRQSFSYTHQTNNRVAQRIGGSFISEVKKAEAHQCVRFPARDFREIVLPLDLLAPLNDYHKLNTLL